MDVMPSPNPNIAMIQAVKDAPRLAPIITRIACDNANAPAFTNPTTMTVAALDDSASAVIENPASMLFTGFLRIHGRKVLNLSPDNFSRPALRRFRP